MYINPKIKLIDNINENDSFFCDLCGFPLFTHDDFSKHKKYSCCSECFLTYVEARRKDWKEGWRPDQTALDEYIYSRKQIKNMRYDSIGSFKVLPKILSDDRMEITCMVVVNLLNRSEMHKATEDAKSSLDKACNLCLKGIKKEFKSACGRALKAKQAGDGDYNVELINMSAYSPKGTALVRAVYKFEIS